MKNAYKIRLAIATVIFLLVILGFVGVFCPIKVLDLQFAPLLQRVFVDFSVIALVLVLAIVAITFVFGRFYCSTICPFGFLQEVVALIFHRKNKAIKNYPVKYYLMALTFGALVGESAVVLRYIEPYSLFGSASTISILGLVAVLMVVVLVFFKNRFFCTNICPVGALLGLVAKFSLNKISINKEMCVTCGMCEKNCSASCINSKEKNIDNETCVRCMKCLQVCPKGGIKFGKQEKKSNEKFSLKRRQLIIGATVLAVFGSMVKTGLVLKEKLVEKVKDIILPAGAISKDRFANKCYNRNLCVQNCPNKILVKADENFSAVHIDYEKGEKFCKFDCNKCGNVCPTGAIKRLSLEDKQNTRIGMAMIIEDKCHKCNACASACPKGAIIKVEGKAPMLNAQKCIGCGACKATCYHEAIEIFSVKEQKNI